MKNPISILVPIDFSSNAVTAYQYALGMADYMNASIKLIHINTEILASSRPIKMVSYPSVKADLEQKLRDFASDKNDLAGKGGTTTTTETEVVEGITVVGEIVRQSQNFDLIIVGAKGENLLSKRLFGSIPSLLAQKAEIPVLVIPMEAEFIPPTKILYASNWESSKPETVHRFVKWSTVFQAQANFLHISQDYAVDKFAKIEEDIFNVLEEYEKLKFAYLIINKKADSPLGGILEYANEEDMDWIVLANRQKGFVNNILGLSLSKELTTNPRYPMLILHGG